MSTMFWFQHQESNKNNDRIVDTERFLLLTGDSVSETPDYVKIQAYFEPWKDNGKHFSDLGQ